MSSLLDSKALRWHNVWMATGQMGDKATTFLRAKVSDSCMFGVALI
ncbi:hypothetical protein HanPI659440_Chr16g0655911 [Helianthus annuus]|nr:hypothetical protein HanPI659440_Chr16g0655911 [Helianthus annuus]